MGILSRFVTVLQANLNALLSHVEDPARILDQTIRDLESAYRKAKDHVAHAMADQKRLEKALADAQAEVSRWSEHAVRAVEKGDDTLAKEALRRKNEHARACVQASQELATQQGHVESLKQALQDLEAKIGEIKRKKAQLVGKQRRAQAQDEIYQTLQGGRGGGALETVQRMEEKIESMAALSAARRELHAELSQEQLERKFRELGAGSPDVERELLEIRQRLQIEHKRS
ncbi:MAG TPA: PspA/IM30 family protein [bacterium]|nr:PspA/IM30 family protein [bacterium]